ncbi:MAG: LLM class F420-dependent oxidoreductase [Chloroflexi bacterium]|nr:LLM class F420-dependent oxidoreductase [Chloroflexota bacterium]MQG01177.1 LLM class F420-dependent oxidoreductase [SAR202 cluster bacterium]|tara:strand:- start:6513 stop:7379 length:867 start_codon:yes stop_codon:yes gene_type:complete
MRIGAVFPQTESGTDPGAIKAYSQAVESLGFDHILAFDHVIGANAESRPGWSGAYRHTDSFYEPLVLFGHIAATTEKIELVTGIIILPQRQTVLAAKQAATVSLLSGGRLRMGIGIGWNPVEYEALDQDFSTRGKRSEEQIDLMRSLWQNELITYEGKSHKVTDAGINPLPPEGSIPIWFGGTADIVLKRVARLGDGWMPVGKPDESRQLMIEKLTGYLREEGRDIGDIGIESWVTLKDLSDSDVQNEIDGWRNLGATHLSVNTMNSGLKFPDEHINSIEKFLQMARP